MSRINGAGSEAESVSSRYHRCDVSLSFQWMSSSFLLRHSFHPLRCSARKPEENLTSRIIRICVEDIPLFIYLNYSWYCKYDHNLFCRNLTVYTFLILLLSYDYYASSCCIFCLHIKLRWFCVQTDLILVLSLIRDDLMRITLITHWN